MMSTECAERAARGAAAGNGVLSRVHKNAIARVFFKIYPPLGGCDERLQRELAAAEKAKDVAAHRRHIVDKLLVLACPRCAQVFVDFEGCFALTVEKKYRKFQVVFCFNYCLLIMFSI